MYETKSIVLFTGIAIGKHFLFRFSASHCVLVPELAVKFEM